MPGVDVSVFVVRYGGRPPTVGDLVVMAWTDEPFPPPPGWKFEPRIGAVARRWTGTEAWPTPRPAFVISREVLDPVTAEIAARRRWTDWAHLRAPSIDEPGTPERSSDHG